jgi:hypothetical protein
MSPRTPGSAGPVIGSPTAGTPGSPVRLHERQYLARIGTLMMIPLTRFTFPYPRLVMILPAVSKQYLISLGQSNVKTATQSLLR